MNRLKDFLSQFQKAQLPDIYAQKSRWKWYLGIAGMIIIVISSVFTYYLVDQLKVEEERKMRFYAKSIEVQFNITASQYDSIPEPVRQFLTSIPLENQTIPVILTDDRFNVIDAMNLSGFDTLQTARDSALVQNKLNQLIHSGRKPIVVNDVENLLLQRIYYDDSRILTLLKYYPAFQLFLIGLFVGFGYLAFSTARRSEQNQVWVGMAKETAHQLGTPIAAILGWIEHLRVAHEDDEMTQEVINELENDVSRLSLVADRFSKIGSEPELLPKNIFSELGRCRDYMQKRAPRKVSFDFPKGKNEDGTPQYIFVKINAHLFDWVIENLLRNALDAMEGGEGTISARVYEEDQWTCVDISDTGKGIPRDKWKTVFQPGFTTKKRGWGLGLSLTKRIVENYHGGKIFIKDSVVGKGTTFTIKLPKV